jgi:hypothetical protein
VLVSKRCYKSYSIVLDLVLTEHFSWSDGIKSSVVRLFECCLLNYARFEFRAAGGSNHTGILRGMIY